MQKGFGPRTLLSLALGLAAATHGTVTFRTYFDPITVGSFVMHCHMLQHEDIGMMQRLEIKPPPFPSIR